MSDILIKEIWIRKKIHQRHACTEEGVCEDTEKMAICKPRRKASEGTELK